MQLLDCIKVYDNVLPLEPIGSFVKWLGTQKFQPAPTIGGINREIRKADHYKLDIKSPLQSNVHWHNFLYKALRKHLQKYAENFIEFRCDRFIDILALKYEQTGFYKYHIDSSFECFRTVSCILLLNNDYEGGALSFGDPQNLKQIKKIEIVPNRLIIWPSNFLFPHSVLPVTKGLRYSVVAWAF